MYLKIAALKPVMEKYRKSLGNIKTKTCRKRKIKKKSLLKTNENLLQENTMKESTLIKTL